LNRWRDAVWLLEMLQLLCAKEWLPDKEGAGDTAGVATA
jgi:hypothetical protein